MNDAGYLGALARAAYRAFLGTRRLRATPKCQAVGVSGACDGIERIYVISLDRQSDRWRRMQRELRGVRDRSGKPLIELTRRFSAVDARQLKRSVNTGLVQPNYLLADHLRIEPHPQLVGNERVRTRVIEMTQQEIAVALSHIHVWQLVARGESPYTLVLEDDVCFRRDFARRLDRAWSAAVGSGGCRDSFDVLYLSYKEVLTGVERKQVSPDLFRPLHGLWQLSGYVVSARGAQRLLESLPVRGPVDLWINHQFSSLEVFATQSSIVDQRRDFRSSNVHSILPVLSQAGVLTREKPLLAKRRKFPGPVFAFGEPGTGLTSLAMALSMLGYRCCSDVAELPIAERRRLFKPRSNRVFDAYVNVGGLDSEDYVELAKLYPSARFVVTKGNETGRIDVNRSPAEPSPFERRPASGCASLADKLRTLPREVLGLHEQEADKWELLRTFLNVEYPSDPYPESVDLGQRPLVEPSCGQEVPAPQILSSDSSPWIAMAKDWRGISLGEVDGDGATRTRERVRFEGVDSEAWMLRDDTFPSNLALFAHENFSIERGHMRLTFREEPTEVRQFTSAAICSRHGCLYGSFSAEVRPAKVPGLITGVFLHRNSPRQEIDIEFVGKDTRRMLVNVYYNPGGEGARMEYGYRGTPALVDLGFDASEEFHLYEIEWRATSIRWLVDGQLVHERVNWNPTPIPHLPMQFNVNLWHSRSTEFAGKLDRGDLPAHTDVRSIEISSGPGVPYGVSDRYSSLSAPPSRAPYRRVSCTPQSSIAFGCVECGLADRACVRAATGAAPVDVEGEAVNRSERGQSRPKPRPPYGPALRQPWASTARLRSCDSVIVRRLIRWIVRLSRPARPAGSRVTAAT